MRKAMKNRQTHPKCTEQMLSRNQILIPCLLKFVQAEYVGVLFWAFLSGCLHWVAKNSKLQSSKSCLEQILLEDNFTCWWFWLLHQLCIWMSKQLHLGLPFYTKKNVLKVYSLEWFWGPQNFTPGRTADSFHSEGWHCKINKQINFNITNSKWFKNEVI